jgi:LysM repeat protein
LYVKNDDLIAAQKEMNQVTPVVEQPKLNPTPPPAKYKYYTIKSGDTLYKIASMYKVSVADIMKWNNLKSKNIRAGAKLKIKVG